jgi:AraC-like DNA-binding protein
VVITVTRTSKDDLRDRFFKYLAMRKSGMGVKEIATHAGVSESLVKSTFTVRNAVALGLESLIGEMRVSKITESAKTPKASSESTYVKLYDIIKSQLLSGEALHDLRVSNVTKGGISAALFETLARQASHDLLRCDEGFARRVDALIYRGVSVYVIADTFGLSERALKKRAQKLLKGRVFCTQCGSLVDNREITRFLRTKRSLCRSCLYDGNPDPVLDPEEVLGLMRNDRRGDVFGPR